MTSKGESSGTGSGVPPQVVDKLDEAEKGKDPLATNDATIQPNPIGSSGSSKTGHGTDKKAPEDKTKKNKAAADKEPGPWRCWLVSTLLTVLGAHIFAALAHAFMRFGAHKAAKDHAVILHFVCLLGFSFMFMAAMAPNGAMGAGAVVARAIFIQPAAQPANSSSGMSAACAAHAAQLQDTQVRIGGLLGVGTFQLAVARGGFGFVVDRLESAAVKLQGLMELASLELARAELLKAPATLWHITLWTYLLGGNACCGRNLVLVAVIWLHYANAKYLDQCGSLQPRSIELLVASIFAVAYLFSAACLEQAGRPDPSLAQRAARELAAANKAAKRE